MVNPIYQKSETVQQLKTLFQKNKILPSIQLHTFFTEQEYTKIKSIIKSSTFKHTKKPLLYSYSQAPIKKELPSFLLEIQSITATILSQKISLKNLQLLQFQHKDYTLLNDKSIEPQGYDIILDLTEHWQPEYGGNLIYTNGQLTSYTIPSKPNTLTIIKRTKHFQKYLEYINHYAKKQQRYILIITLPLKEK
ncbi:MAG: hypothetical protein A3D39_00630 [Candidatus Buchananbacteria bacterium RIFCSPHIGHO2_02_FULL_39_17]|uniref:Uncharacterized protein n=1 Tax=Candidatus Buchananbacteria bacterium RIFCSPLOWO2_01_FULL_40_23b TaxID=1797544 RepID=A0A1G1YNE8_9BACT|nr:MAG: hypothetical protein A3D39_00630 [Candidatus Buchananbacteria bacterium RIFCSPHIGHO2_02_FULL_39_17]OGY53170.1 MAG: hypothetical protein A2912_04310 [Candidatus Buchananbacteria bacterium RIFCSPLOWO2_01_FULL_40_23b]